jgi:hypothetical protein
MRDRRLIIFCTIGFLILWASAAVYVRSKAVRIGSGILFAAPFLFVLAMILGPPLFGAWRRHRHKTQGVSGTRQI